MWIAFGACVIHAFTVGEIVSETSQEEDEDISSNHIKIYNGPCNKQIMTNNCSNQELISWWKDNLQDAEMWGSLVNYAVWNRRVQFACYAFLLPDPVPCIIQLGPLTCYESNTKYFEEQPVYFGWLEDAAFKNFWACYENSTDTNWPNNENDFIVYANDFLFCHEPQKNIYATNHITTIEQLAALTKNQDEYSFLMNGELTFTLPSKHLQFQENVYWGTLVRTGSHEIFHCHSLQMYHSDTFELGYLRCDIGIHLLYKLGWQYWGYLEDNRLHLRWYCSAPPVCNQIVQEENSEEWTSYQDSHEDYSYDKPECITEEKDYFSSDIMYCARDFLIDNGPILFEHRQTKVGDSTITNTVPVLAYD